MICIWEYNGDSPRHGCTTRSENYKNAFGTPAFELLQRKNGKRCIIHGKFRYSLNLGLKYSGSQAVESSRLKFRLKDTLKYPHGVPLLTAFLYDTVSY